MSADNTIPRWKLPFSDGQFRGFADGHLGNAVNTRTLELYWYIYDPQFGHCWGGEKSDVGALAGLCPSNVRKAWQKGQDDVFILTSLPPVPPSEAFVPRTIILDKGGHLMADITHPRRSSLQTVRNSFGPIFHAAPEPGAIYYTPLLPNQDGQRDTVQCKWIFYSADGTRCHTEIGTAPCLALTQVGQAHMDFGTVKMDGIEAPTHIAPCPAPSPWSEVSLDMKGLSCFSAPAPRRKSLIPVAPSTSPHGWDRVEVELS